MLESNDVLKYVDGGSIGRPHIAKALIERRYVKDVGEASTVIWQKESLLCR